MQTYSTLALVVGGVIVASGVEPSLNIFGAAICFLGAAFRGMRAVMQVCFSQHPLHETDACRVSACENASTRGTAAP